MGAAALLALARLARRRIGAVVRGLLVVRHVIDASSRTLEIVVGLDEALGVLGGIESQVACICADLVAREALGGHAREVLRLDRADDVGPDAQSLRDLVDRESVLAPYSGELVAESVFSHTL